MIPRFFGSSQQPLFGVFHNARGRSQSPHNVLICPPIGHEYVRTHWAIRSIASKLAREGMNVFRFDYRGIGDSSGDVSGVTSLVSWVADACDASLELQEETRDAQTPLTIIGLRWGATLACLAAEEMANTQQVPANLVLWEPACNGAEFLNELRSMHRQMLDLWVSKVETENSATHEEILGFRYCRSLLQEIEHVNLLDTAPAANNTVVITSNKDQTFEHWNLSGDSQIARNEDTNDWADVNFIEEAWLPSSSPLQLHKGLKQFSDQLRAGRTTGITFGSEDVNLQSRGVHA